MTPSPWKVLVVDDAAEVRAVTRLALDGFLFHGRRLQLLEAGSADDARELLLAHNDIAVAIVDVVMETDHAGLDLVRWIRGERHNNLIRLLVRTGQAGLHPADTVLADYEINDYWEKTELTVSRLRTSLTTSLRSYEDLWQLHRRSVQLRHWADRFPDLLGVRDWNSLLKLVMLRLRELFPETPLSAFLCRNDGARWPLISGTGSYPAAGAADVVPHLDERRAALLLDAWDRKAFAESAEAQALYFEVSSGAGHLIFLDIPASWSDYERNVARLVLQNFRAVLENRTLITDLERHQAELSTLLRQQEDVTRDVHHRFQTSLQVVLSLIEIESRDRTGVTGRSALGGAQRRLHVLALLHSVLHVDQRRSRVNFQPFLRALVEHDRAQGQANVEFWGVDVEVEVTKAVPLALAAVEMLDLVQAPRHKGGAQIRLSDGPRELSVGRPGLELDLSAIPLEWQLIETLAAQVGGSARVENGSVHLQF